MTKETFTVPAFEVTLERTEDEDIVIIDGLSYLVTYMREEAPSSESLLERALFAAALAYLDANKPDTEPGFTVRHEVDGEWKWTAVFSPSTGYRACWNVTDNHGNSVWHTRYDFAALCERDGVTL